MRYLSMIRSDEKSGQAPSEQLMQDMGKLIEEMTRNGVLISTAGLRPTAEGVRVRLRSGRLSTTDGPFTETKEMIGGYAILEAKSMHDALELTKRFLRVHGDEWDIECEVRQLDGPEFARWRDGAFPPKRTLNRVQSASRLISARIAALGDWRGDVLLRVRKLIKEADPGITEEWKWSNPVWSHGGIVCTGESYTKVVKLTFVKGASLNDPAALFNSSFDGKVRRAIDIRETDQLDESAFKELVRAAVSLNRSGGR